MAYLNLRREECARLFPQRWNISEVFRIGAHGFVLIARCTMDFEDLSQCFSLTLGLEVSGHANVGIDFEFAERSREKQEKYRRLFKNRHTFAPGSSLVGCRNLFNTPWATFIADDSPFFIDGILYLRVVVSIK